MYKIFLYVFLLNSFILTFIDGYGQKPPLDYPAIENWPNISNQSISSDGKFICYVVTESTKPTLHIKSSDGSFHKEVSGLPGSSFSPIQFTENSRKCIFIKSGDSLCIVDLYSGSETVVPNCTTFTMPQEGNSSWIAYLLLNKDLVLYDFMTGEKKMYSNVNDYLFSSTGKILVLNRAGDLEGKKSSLEWIDLIKASSRIIWEGVRCSGYTFDKSESRLAFFSEDDGGSIWFYQEELKTASILVEAKNSIFERGTKISLSTPGVIGLQYALTNDKLFFTITLPPDILSKDDSKSSVDIWNYKDPQLQETQLVNNNEYLRGRLCVIGLNDKKIKVLKEKGDEVICYIDAGYNYLLVKKDAFTNKTDFTQNVEVRQYGDSGNIYIVEMNSGHRTYLAGCRIGAFGFSPAGKYATWYDETKKTYYVYDVQKKLTYNVSKEINQPLYDVRFNLPIAARALNPTPIWLENDEAILIYDYYDIWKVDPTARKQPFNITKGYGRRNKILLRPLYGEMETRSIRSVKQNDSALILTGFNEINKRNDFFQLNLQDFDLKKLTTNSREYYYFPQVNSAFYFPHFLSKAKFSNTYLLFRQKANEYPNLMTTTDFSKFNQISALAPEKNFNWLTTELLDWTTFNGHKAQGILYKPENFDSTKKYPIIFCFYEERSNKLNLFNDPELCRGQMDIPYFVSNGYLVFSPDIHVEIGKPGPSAYDYVVSAATELKNKPWVDSTKMAIQGHSYGGYEVNYLVTKTKMFAAAAAAAGMTNLASAYGTLHHDAEDGKSWIQFGQHRMAVSLWQDKNRYIDNSPLFGADKVSTPLLIMHNKKDPPVAWSQGVEFISALRWLHKPSWMLQYDDGYHILTKESDLLDYTTRLTQFFDHYLKDAPAPEWMTRGILARLKQIETGYAYDPSRSCGKDCKVCKYWNEKFKRDSVACWKEIERRKGEEHWQYKAIPTIHKTTTATAAAGLQRGESNP